MLASLTAFSPLFFDAGRYDSIEFLQRFLLEGIDTFLEVSKLLLAIPTVLIGICITFEDRDLWSKVRTIEEPSVCHNAVDDSSFETIAVFVFIRLKAIRGRECKFTTKAVEVTFTFQSEDTILEDLCRKLNLI